MKIKDAAIIGGVAVGVWFLAKGREHHEEAKPAPVAKPAVKPVAVQAPRVVALTLPVQSYSDGSEGHYAGAPPVYYSPYNAYGYTGNNPYGYNPYGYESASQCAAQGGLYDSFSNTCSPMGSTGAQAIAPSLYNNYGAYQIPNVIGLSLNVAVRVLNNAGFRVWVVQNESAYSGAPAGVDPGRVDLVISGGAVVSARVG
jgi:hypothetical protein